MQTSLSRVFPRHKEKVKYVYARCGKEFFRKKLFQFSIPFTSEFLWDHYPGNAVGDTRHMLALIQRTKYFNPRSANILLWIKYTFTITSTVEQFVVF